MSFTARNHPQQVAARGALDDVDDRRTPPDLLAECAALARVEAFDLDVAATAENSVAPTFCRDGLREPWWGNVWCNPPYSDLAAWAKRAHGERWACHKVAMLLPANRTEQGWWQDFIEPDRLDNLCDLFFLRGRRRFDRPGWKVPAKGDRPPFGLVLVVW